MLCSLYMKSFNQFKKEALRDSKLQKAYDALEPEFQIVKCLIDQRLQRGMTQAQLAKKLKTKQSAISRFESGTSNPTIDFLQKLADALNVKLQITVSSHR